MSSKAVELAQTLLAIPSVTPDQGAGLLPIRERLETLGFETEDMTSAGVANLYARLGTGRPAIAFLGHTDVVPIGDEAVWSYPPFEPSLEDGYLYARGAADMKGAIAAFLVAVEALLEGHSEPQGSLILLITGDEEGPAIHGTRIMIERLQARNETIDYCLVGEPSCEVVLGDTIKNGRRGSLTGELSVLGTQGHVAYPHHADNPIHRALPVLTELIRTQFDTGNASFPPTSFQIANLHAGTGAHNVIPGRLEAQFNFRFGTANTADSLQDIVRNTLDAAGLKYELHWHSHGDPFLTEPGRLTDALLSAIRDVTGFEGKLSTAGGTSDGRYVAPTGAQVAEFGFLNQTIHQVDERVAVADLEQLVRIYRITLERLLCH